MASAQTNLIRKKFAGLRAELIELAFALERQGRLDAADTALMISGRVEELSRELAPARPVRALEPCR